MTQGDEPSRPPLCFACACARLRVARGGRATSWAQPQIKVVTAQRADGRPGGGLPAGRPADRGDLGDLVAGPDRQGGHAPGATRRTPVTIAQLDAQLVRGLGLLPAARQFSARPPRRRPGAAPLLRHRGRRAAPRPARQPSGRARTRSSSVPTTSRRAPRPRTRPRTSSASPAARPTSSTGSPATFQLPVADHRPSARSSRPRVTVGYPYVWGGTSEIPQDPFETGNVLPGGFDCSGFAWRVYKLQAYPAPRRSRATLKGRTTYAMSGEVPRAERIGLAEAPARRPALLRAARAEVEAGPDRPHGHLPGQRLVHPVLRPGRRPRRRSPPTGTRSDSPGRAARWPRRAWPDAR